MTTARKRVFKSKPFPSVTIESDAGYWSGDIEVGGTTLTTSLYVDAQVSDAALKDAARLLIDLTDLRERARAAIASAAASGETIMRDFFQVHLDEAPGSLPAAVRAEATNEAFVGALEMCGVGVHAHEELAFHVVLDFSFGRAHSDQILAVKFSPDGAVCHVSHES